MTTRRSFIISPAVWRPGRHGASPHLNPRSANTFDIDSIQSVARITPDAAWPPRLSHGFWEAVSGRGFGPRFRAKTPTRARKRPPGSCLPEGLIPDLAVHPRHPTLAGRVMERWGVGIRHILFPRSTDIWRPIPPVEWISAASSPTPRLQCENDRPAFPAPRRSRPTVSPPPAFRVRLLGPAAVRLQAQRVPDSGLAITAGRGKYHPGFSEVGIASAIGPRSFAPEYGSCLLPLTLLFNPRRTILFPEPPACSGIIDLIRGHHPVGCLPAAGLSPRRISPFFLLPAATPGDFAVFYRSKPQDFLPPHWLTAATLGLGPTVFAPAPPSTMRWARDSASREVARNSNPAGPVPLR